MPVHTGMTASAPSMGECIDTIADVLGMATRPCPCTCSMYLSWWWRVQDDQGKTSVNVDSGLDGCTCCPPGSLGAHSTSPACARPATTSRIMTLLVGDLLATMGNGVAAIQVSITCPCLH